MKYLLFFLFPIHIAFTSLAADVSISGTIKDGSNQKIYLSLHKGSETVLIDSAVIDAKENFTFILKDGYKQGVYKLWNVKEKQAIIIVGREEKIKISGNLSGLSEGKITINSSKENDAYAVLTNFFKMYSNEIDSLQFLMNQIQRFDPKKDSKSKAIKSEYSLAIIRFNNSVRLIPSMFSGTFTAEVLCPLYQVAEKTELTEGKDFDTEEAFQHAHYFHYVDFSNAGIVNTLTYEKKLFTYLDMYVEHTVDGFKKGVDNIMSQAKKNTEVRDFTVAFLLDVFTKKGPPELVEYVHDNYSEGCELPMKSETEKLLLKLKQISNGTPAPELLINDINYSPVSLKNTINGKLGMIYFWASTCPHCMEHTPKVFEVYQKYKNKGFEVYSVSLDKEYGDWLKAIQDMKLEWVNVCDLKGWNSEVINTYALERTPTIFLIDKEGNILDKNFSPSELENKLKKYLP